MKRRENQIKNYFLENKLLIFGIIISGLFFDGLMCIVPLVLGDAINSFSNQEKYSIILYKCLILLGLVLFVQINRFFKRYFVRLFANKITFAMRSKAIDSFLYQPIENIKDENKADLLNKNLSDIADCAEGIRKVTTEIFDSIVILIGYFTTMIIIDYKITLLAMIFVLVSIMLASLLKKIIYKYTLRYKEAQSRLKGETLSMISNEIYYRGLGVNDEYQKNYENKALEYKNASFKHLILQGSLEPIYNAIALCGLFFVIYLGGIKVIDGSFLLGTFTAYLNLFILASTKASKVGKTFNSYIKAKVSWERIKPIMDFDVPLEVNPTINDEYYKAEKVEFGFTSRILKDLSFDFRLGERIGVKGKVHSGKSTLGLLLTGIYEYKGSLKLFGNEVNQNVNFKIAYAPQTPEIFNASIKDNILLGGNGDYVEASKKALLYDEIVAMPEGFFEMLSHTQINLSGGQQKRLQIARCIVNQPNVIILDDAFSSIDNDMALKIIDNLPKEALVFIISNNQEILEKMNHVINMDEVK